MSTNLSEISWPDCQNQTYEGRFNISPVSVILCHLAWESIVILSDVLHLPLQFETLLERESTEYFSFNISNQSSIEEVLDYHSNPSMPSSIFLVVCSSTRSLIDLLQEINTHDTHYDEQGVLTYHHRWLIFKDSNADMKLIETNIVNITYLSVVIGQRHSGLTRVYTAMWKPSGRKLQPCAQIAHNSISGEIFPTIRYGLNGRTFLVTTLMWGPFVKKLNGKRGNARYIGFCIEILETVAASLNFTYILIQPPDGEWGRINNVTWTGLIGQLAYKGADMMAAPATVQAARTAVMDMSYTFYTEEAAIIYKHTQSPIANALLFIRPYKWQVWTCMIALIPCTGLLVWYLSHLMTWLYRKKRVVNPLLSQRMWITFGTALNQSATKISESPVIRAVYISWIFTCVIFTVTYGSNLVALLAVEMETKPFNTLHEFALQDKYKYGILGGSSYVNQFKESRGIYSTMYKRIVQWENEVTPTMSISHRTHLDLVDEGGYGYFIDATAGVLHAQTSCDLKLFRDNLSPYIYAMGFQNNSAYRDQASKVILKLRQTGLLARWKQQYWPKATGCQKASASSKTIEVKDLIGLFCTFLGMLVLSSAVFFCEILSFARRSNKTCSSIPLCLIRGYAKDL